MKKVLHVGCGMKEHDTLDALFRDPEWQEIRLDINPACQPDYVQDMRNMPDVPDSSMDGVWSSHNIEHLHAHEVPLALGEFHRVLKEGGLLGLRLPDLQRVAEYVARGELEDAMYDSPAGPITPLDAIYGHTASITGGNHFMAHKTGFTAQTLAKKLLQCGFARITVVRQGFDLLALAYRDSQAPIRDRTGFTLRDAALPG